MKKLFFILLISTTLNSYSQKDSIPYKNEIKFDILLIPSLVFSPESYRFLLSYEKHLSDKTSVSFSPGVRISKPFEGSDLYRNKFNLICSYNVYPSKKEKKHFYYGISILNAYSEEIYTRTKINLLLALGGDIYEAIYTEFKKEWIIGGGPHFGFGIDLNKRFKLGGFFLLNCQSGIIGKANIHEVKDPSYNIEDYNGYSRKLEADIQFNISINYKF